MGKLDGLRKHKNQLIDDRKKVLERLSDVLIELPLRMILPELRHVMDRKEEAHKRIEQQRQQSQELKGSLEFARKLLKMESCVCGRPIGAAQAEFINDHLKELGLKVKRAEGAIEKEDPTYFEVRETIVRIESSSADFQGYQKDIDEKDLQLDEIEGQIKSIDKSLSEVDEEKVNNLNAQRNAVNQEIGRLEEREKELQEKVTRLEEARNRIIANIERREGRDAIRSALDKQMSLASKASDAFDYVLGRLVEVRRVAIEKLSTELFRALTNKPEEYDKITIDKDYNVSVIDKDGNSVSRETLSTGEREIVALSFIFGLMKASEKAAPLVLDTFFVHLDEAHYSNIVKAMPTFAHQIILVLTDLEYKNLRDRASGEFFDHVVQIFEVLRNKEAAVSSLKLEMGALIEK